MTNMKMTWKIFDKQKRELLGTCRLSFDNVPVLPNVKKKKKLPAKSQYKYWKSDGYA